ncbi:MAG: polysaccharide pyruvyl transferase family protein, partial [Candidatus Gastranaerophilales bacterium]|nr:polysaccharide pyruvyl transferase family protein [Candidatus Gastranaerophilales bacterium]
MWIRDSYNLAQAEYLVAMRFHAIIIGLLAGVKTLGINYDIKIEKIAAEFNLPLINMQKDFNNQFQDLKHQDLNKIKSKLESKNFNWSGFENTLKNNV